MPGDIARVTSEDRNAATVRFWNRRGEAVGVGFVVGQGLVMTCAHVVAVSLGRAEVQFEPAKPTEAVEIDFFADPDHSRKKATVVEWRPRRQSGSGRDEPDDVAVLELCLGEQVPQAAKSAPVGVGCESGDKVRAIGVARNIPDGRGVEGHVGEMLVGRWSFTTTNADVAVREGCSGAAVWAPGRGGVVGMVVEMQQEMTGLFLPLSALRKVWPELRGGPAVAPSAVAPPRALNQRLTSQIKACDRQDQESYCETALADRWDLQRRPLICVIAGVADDMPEVCQDRCQERTLYPRLKKMNVNTGKLGIRRKLTWPNQRRFNVDEALDALKSGLRLNIGADDTSAESLRRAYNEGLRAWIFYSEIDHRWIGEHHTTLMRRWAAFLQELGQISYPLSHFVLLTLDAGRWNPSAPSPDAALRGYYRGIVKDLLAAEVRALPLLQSLKTRDVEDWLDELAGELELAPGDIEGLKFQVQTRLRPINPLRLQDVQAWAQKLDS
jgi:hypothetical protein